MSLDHPILKQLSQGIDREGREELRWRYEAMCSELNYISEKDPEKISIAGSLGWSKAKLEVVFCLNSFYQRILAPLISAGIGMTEIGENTPIRYGQTMRFDTARSQRVMEMDKRFSELCKECGITQKMLEASRTSDLLWLINNEQEDNS